MWPSRKSQGVKVSYGHDGSGVYIPHVTPDTPWQFARRHGLGFNFHSSGIYDVLSKAPPWTDDHVRYDINQHRDVGQTLYNGISAFPGDFVPVTMSAALEFESLNVTSSRGYNPLRGSLVDTGPFKTRKKEINSMESEKQETWDAPGHQHNDHQSSEDEDEDEDEDDEEDNIQGIVFAGGKGGTSLNFGYLGLESQKIYTTNLDDDNKSFTIRKPKVRIMQSYNMNSPLYQVEFSEPEPSVSPYILVRTEQGTSLLDVSTDANKTTLDVYKRLNIPLNSLSQSDKSQSYLSQQHCHSTFNPWSYSQFGIINSQGIWGLWDMTEMPFSLSSKPKAPIVMSRFHAESQTLSRWNQMIWGADTNSILTANRRHLRLFDVRNGDSVNDDIFSFKNNDKQICGLSRSKLNDHNIILLTSESVMLLDMRKPGGNEMVFSWDHFMNRKDPSLRLTSTAINEVNLITIYSQLQHASIVYEFTESNGFPVSAEDPYLLVTPPDRITQTMINIHGFITDENDDNDDNDDDYDNDNDSKMKIMSCIRLTTELELSSEVLISSDQSVKLTKDVQGESNGNERPIDVANYPSKKTAVSGTTADEFPYDYVLNMDFSRIDKMDFRQMYKFLFENTSNIPDLAGNDEDIELLARHLGKGINKLFSNKSDRVVNLLELNGYDPELLSSPLRLYENLDHLSELIEQLKEHYKGTNIHILDLAYNLKTIFNEDISKNIKENYYYLLSLWVEPLESKTKDMTNNSINEIVLLRRQKLALHIAIEVTLACIGVFFDHNNSEVEHEEDLSGLNKYAEVKNIDSFELTPTAQLLIDEWTTEANPDDYKWHKFGDRADIPDVPSSPSRLFVSGSSYLDSQQRLTRSQTRKKQQQTQPGLGLRPSPQKLSSQLVSSGPMGISKSQTQTHHHGKSSQEAISKRSSHSQPALSTRSMTGSTQSKRQKKKKRTEGFG